MCQVSWLPGGTVALPPVDTPWPQARDHQVLPLKLERPAGSDGS